MSAKTPKIEVLRHYKLHMHFDIVWLSRKKIFRFLKKCILDISWKSWNWLDPICRHRVKIIICYISVYYSFQNCTRVHDYGGWMHQWSACSCSSRYTHIFQCIAELCYMTTLTAIQCIAVKWVCLLARSLSSYHRHLNHIDSLNVYVVCCVLMVFSHTLPYQWLVLLLWILLRCYSNLEGSKYKYSTTSAYPGCPGKEAIKRA